MALQGRSAMSRGTSRTFIYRNLPPLPGPNAGNGDIRCTDLRLRHKWIDSDPRLVDVNHPLTEVTVRSSWLEGWMIFAGFTMSDPVSSLPEGGTTASQNQHLTFSISFLHRA